MKGRAPLTIGAALLLLPFTPTFQAHAEGEASAAPPAPARAAASSKPAAGPAPVQAAPSPAKQEELAPQQATVPPAKPEPAPAQAGANPAKPDPPTIKLSCRAVRNDIGMYEPLRFMSITIDLPKKYVKVVHEGDGKAFEFTDGGGRKKSAAFVKITDDAVVYGQQGRESWRIDRYTGTMTSSSFTIQFECQPRPAERKF
jgi:hypothetical protein